jgi:hypothetical protein
MWVIDAHIVKYLQEMFPWHSGNRDKLLMLLWACQHVLYWAQSSWEEKEASVWFWIFPSQFITQCVPGRRTFSITYTIPYSIIHLSFLPSTCTSITGEHRNLIKCKQHLKPQAAHCKDEYEACLEKNLQPWVQVHIQQVEKIYNVEHGFTPDRQKYLFI